MDLDPKGENVEVAPRETPDTTEGNMLTGREQEVLLLGASGLSNRQMASRLYLAEATISRHFANTYEKLGVHSRSQATSKALAERWITPETSRRRTDEALTPDTTLAGRNDLYSGKKLSA